MRASVQAKQAGGQPVSQIEVAKKVIQDEGVGGLYRLVFHLVDTKDENVMDLTRHGTFLNSGIDSALSGVAMTNGIYYFAYETVKSAFEQAAGIVRPMTTVESMTAGAVAGGFPLSLGARGICAGGLTLEEIPQEPRPRSQPTPSGSSTPA